MARGKRCPRFLFFIFLHNQVKISSKYIFVPLLKISSFIHGLSLKHIRRLLDRSLQLFTSLLTRPNNPGCFSSRTSSFFFHGAAIAHWVRHTALGAAIAHLRWTHRPQFRVLPFLFIERCCNRLLRWTHCTRGGHSPLEVDTPPPRIDGMRPSPTDVDTPHPEQPSPNGPLKWTHHSGDKATIHD